MSIPDFAKKYMLTGLAATPDVLEALLARVKPSDQVWNFTPDPHRFTLRSVVAHLADWDPIFLTRIIRTRDEEEPNILGVDEGQLAIDNDYASSDPIENIARFRAAREILVQTVGNLGAADWDRVCRREFGPISVLMQSTLILGHDGYHMQQITQWLEAGHK